jgi:hypothetical protein
MGSYGTSKHDGIYRAAGSICFGSASSGFTTLHVLSYANADWNACSNRNAATRICRYCSPTKSPVEPDWNFTIDSVGVPRPIRECVNSRFYPKHRGAYVTWDYSV